MSKKFPQTLTEYLTPWRCRNKKMSMFKCFHVQSWSVFMDSCKLNIAGTMSWWSPWAGRVRGVAVGCLIALWAKDFNRFRGVSSGPFKRPAWLKTVSCNVTFKWRESISHKICTWFCCALFCRGYIDGSRWIYVIYLPISFRVTSQAPGQSHDCPGACKATLKDMGKIIQNLTITNHDKARTECLFLGMCQVS